jgi:hypothetical protein
MGKWNEPVCNVDLESLGGLRIVVHHQGDAVPRLYLCQCTIPYTAEISSFACGEAVKALDQWSIEKGEFVMHLVQVRGQRVAAGLPELPNAEAIVAELRVQILNEFEEKAFGVVLDGIETESVQTQFFGYPRPPVLDIRPDLGVSIIHCGQKTSVVVRLVGLPDM